MFNSLLDAVIFGIIATFFTGIIVSIVARVNLNKIKSNN